MGYFIGAHFYMYNINTFNSFQIDFFKLFKIKNEHHEEMKITIIISFMFLYVLFIHQNLDREMRH